MWKYVFRGATIVAIATFHAGCTELISGLQEPVLDALEIHSSGDVSAIMANETLQLTAEWKDQFGDPIDAGTVTWSSANEAVATVDAARLVTGAATGAATISAVSGSVSATFELTVAGTLHADHGSRPVQPCGSMKARAYTWAGAPRAPCTWPARPPLRWS